MDYTVLVFILNLTYSWSGRRNVRNSSLITTRQFLRLWRNLAIYVMMQVNGQKWGQNLAVHSERLDTAVYHLENLVSGTVLIPFQLHFNKKYLHLI